MVISKTMNDIEADIIAAAYSGDMSDNTFIISSDTNKLFIKFDDKLYKVKPPVEVPMFDPYKTFVLSSTNQLYGPYNYAGFTEVKEDTSYTSHDFWRVIENNVLHPDAFSEPLIIKDPNFSSTVNSEYAYFTLKTGDTVNVELYVSKTLTDSGTLTFDDFEFKLASIDGAYTVDRFLTLSCEVQDDNNAIITGSYTFESDIKFTLDSALVSPSSVVFGLCINVPRDEVSNFSIKSNDITNEVSTITIVKGS